jgi:hypothetical protein
MPGFRIRSMLLKMRPGLARLLACWETLIHTTFQAFIMVIVLERDSLARDTAWVLACLRREIEDASFLLYAG